MMGVFHERQVSSPGGAIRSPVEDRASFSSRDDAERVTVLTRLL